MGDNACCVWDFTLGEEHGTVAGLKQWLKKHCKSWAFQLEKGENSGYLHYQGRFSLKLKKRESGVVDLFENKKVHISRTSEVNSKNNFYVTTEETRVEGPWMDTDFDPYIPWDVRSMETLWPFQDWLCKLGGERCIRNIDMVIDPKGGHGKTMGVRYACVNGFCRQIPFANDYQAVLRIVMDMPKAKCYLIDMPRAINKERLYQWTAAIETIKGGYAYDDRFKFKDEYFDPPRIVVFCNKDVDEEGCMTSDRWIKWGFNSRKELVPWTDSAAFCAAGFSKAPAAVTLENPLIR